MWLKQQKTKNIIEIILFVSHQQFFPYLCRQIGNAHTSRERERENKQQQKHTTKPATFVRILEIKSVNITKTKIMPTERKLNHTIFSQISCVRNEKINNNNKRSTHWIHSLTHSFNANTCDACMYQQQQSFEHFNGLTKRAHWNNCRLQISFQALSVNQYRW